ncbi:SLATT domain-containing protein [Methylobacterium sp. J-026]|uniref:SLATT domain-containing protein n=1 Tax=Methylobacterium sp. J-026 TaxID=2836624 RepID=UPI001FBAD16E|nr:SLATT domain-containing protein [Methylobacterium sp. J-026]MCJ2136848.1 SLATT domain-containing protein [Methylobacterium sp. J-026]
MDKAGLLKSIAETGYNVGFGAKKHYATFDIVEKAPGWIGFISTGFGIFGLVYESLSAKLPSATLTFLGVSALYISFYRSKKYDEVGRQLTQLFNQLRDLYRSVEGGANLIESATILKEIESKYYSIAISRQILFSDWYTHYKFFAQQQIDWINEQKNFTWKDMWPLSFRMFCGVAVVALIAGGIYLLK